MPYKAIPILLKHAGWFSRKPKWDDDDFGGIPFDMPEGQVITLPDGTKTLSLGGGLTIDLPDDFFDDDYEEEPSEAESVKKTALKELYRRSK